MDEHVWLAPIALEGAPTAFAVDASGIFVSFGLSTSRYDLEGKNPVHLVDSSTNVGALMPDEDILYVFTKNNSEITSVNKDTGAVIMTKSYFQRMSGISIAPSLNMVFGCGGGYPTDVYQVTFDSKENWANNRTPLITKIPSTGT